MVDSSLNHLLSFKDPVLGIYDFKARSSAQICHIPVITGLSVRSVDWEGYKVIPWGTMWKSAVKIASFNNISQISHLCHTHSVFNLVWGWSFATFHEVLVVFWEIFDFVKRLYFDSVSKDLTVACNGALLLIWGSWEEAVDFDTRAVA